MLENIQDKITMKKTLIITTVLLNAIPAFSSDSLDITGFRIIKDDSEAMVLHFQDQSEFIISKKRFHHQAGAIAFCKQKGSRIDTGFNSLLIGMSGATNFNKFLNDSISFRINKQTGIWQWKGSGDKVTILLDGRGMDAEDVSIDDLNEVTEVKLPAICLKSLK